MKKLLLLFAACFSCITAHAQYRFYAGIQAGPKVSFSNTILIGKGLASGFLNDNTYSKIRHQKGIVVGFNFLKERFTLESGYSEHVFAMVVKFNKGNDYPEPPVLVFNYTGNEIPILFKVAINKPEARIKLRGIFGVARFYQSSAPEFVDQSIKEAKSKYDPYCFPYVVGQPENFTFQPLDQFGSTFKKIWPIHVGFETETKLMDHLNLRVSAIYQNSIRPVATETFEYNYNYQRGPVGYRGVYYEPMQYGSMQSKAEALNLNIGLTYSFSQRNKGS